MTTTRTSHYDIVKFWMGKRFSDVVSISPQLDDLVIPWVEYPACWCCGKQFYKEPPVATDDETEDGFYRRIWSDSKVTSKVNKCHIIPAALGGKDSPENLVLLCEECHVLSPDTTNISAFFRFISKRRKEFLFGKMSPNALFAKVNEELADRGYPSMQDLCVKMCNLNPNIDLSKDPFDEFMKTHAGTHGASIADATLIVAFTDYILDLYRKCGCE